MHPQIQINIVDAQGVQQTFRAGRVDLDCGCGCINLRAGGPAFCRGFEHGDLTIDDGETVTKVNITRGMASIACDAVQITCEAATVAAPVMTISEDNIRPQSESDGNSTTKP